jgi:hypothetical protein
VLNEKTSPWLLPIPADEVWEKRERILASRIRKIVARYSERPIVYIGGWLHLVHLTKLVTALGTSPGFGSGKNWRREQRLPRGGPSAVITTLGVLRFDPVSREAYLAQVHPGVSPKFVREHTGWDLALSPNLSITPEPCRDELGIIRQYDPQGFWTGRR